MRCDEVLDMLPLFVGGDLARKMEVEVWAHVSSCPKCHEEVVKYQQAHHLLRGLAHPEIPPYLLDEMWELVKVRIGGVNETICQKVARLIPLVVGKDVPAKTRESVESHAAECAECAETLAEYAESRSALKELRSPEIPEHITRNLWTNIKARIESEPVLTVVEDEPRKAGRIVALLSVSSKVATRVAAIAMIFVLGALFYNVAQQRGLFGGTTEEIETPGEGIANDDIETPVSPELPRVVPVAGEAPFTADGFAPENEFRGIFRLLEGVMEDARSSQPEENTEPETPDEEAAPAQPAAESQFVLPESQAPEADEDSPRSF